MNAVALYKGRSNLLEAYANYSRESHCNAYTWDDGMQ